MFYGSYARLVDADSVEIRVLGCMIEKQRTTPDVYPLSLNALRAACNQTTNRDPVVSYDEATIRSALHRLAQRRWARLASGPGSRAVKYRHLLDEALGLSGSDLSILAVLMLRGPQTTGELRARTERMATFASLAEVEEALGNLSSRGLVARLPRRPGQKEDRFVQLLGDNRPEAADEVAPADDGVETAPADNSVEARLRRLEDEVAALRAAMASLAMPVAPPNEDA